MLGYALSFPYKTLLASVGTINAPSTAKRRVKPRWKRAQKHKNKK